MDYGTIVISTTLLTKKIPQVQDLLVGVEVSATVHKFVKCLKPQFISSQ